MSGYHLVWQFETDEARHAAFETAYGPDGDWVRLFRESDGFLESELFRDVTGGWRYVTIDRWVSRGAYDAFRLRHAAAYTELDARCDALLVREMFLGEGDGGR